MCSSITVGRVITIAEQREQIAEAGIKSALTKAKECVEQALRIPDGELVLDRANVRQLREIIASLNAVTY